MTTILLGNTAPLMADGSPARIGNTVTEVILRDDALDAEVSELATSTDNDPVLNVIRDVVAVDYAVAVLEVNDLWSTAHSADPPEWVECDDEGLAEALAAWWSPAGQLALHVDTVARLSADTAFARAMSTHLAAAATSHTCQVGRPDGWTSATDIPPLAGGAAETEWSHFAEDVRSRHRIRELLTNAGRDAFHAQHVGTGAQPAAFTYLALANSASATAPTTGDTTLAGEITTAGGGLIRGTATYAHTAGTNTSTLTRTFTANGSDSLPVTVSQVAVFNAASSGTMAYKTALGTNATLSASGDNVAITWTLTGG